MNHKQNIFSEKINNIIGTWRLISFEIRNLHGQVSYPFGQDAIGYLMYNSDGYMSATLMRANRPKFATGDIAGGSVDEQVTALQSYLTYLGRFELQDNKVIHHIEASLFPNWVGVTQERFFEVKDNQLVLSTDPLLIKTQQQVAHLIWERILDRP